MRQIEIRIRYALLISILASRAPRPARATALAASSMDTYDSEHSSGRMPSLTLRPSGDYKSNMRRHLFNPFLGMTPNLLTWTLGSDAGGKGPRILPSAHSLARYSRMISGCSRAECILFFALYTVVVIVEANPKPSPDAPDNVVGKTSVWMIGQGVLPILPSERGGVPFQGRRYYLRWLSTAW